MQRIEDPWPDLDEVLVVVTDRQPSPVLPAEVGMPGGVAGGKEEGKPQRVGRPVGVTELLDVVSGASLHQGEALRLPLLHFVFQEHYKSRTYTPFHGQH